MARNATLHSPQPISRTPDRTPERTLDRRSDRVDERRLERPDNRRLTDDGRFSIDLNRVPHNMVMEWKRHPIMSMVDKRNQVVIQQYHWKPVLHRDQPDILGHLCTNPDEHIIVDGLGLYMRPKYLNDEAMAEGKWETDHQLSQQLQALRLTSKDQVGDRYTAIKKQTVAVPQPIE